MTNYFYKNNQNTNLQELESVSEVYGDDQTRSLEGSGRVDGLMLNSAVVRQEVIIPDENNEHAEMMEYYRKI